MAWRVRLPDSKPPRSTNGKAPANWKNSASKPSVPGLGKKLAALAVGLVLIAGSGAAFYEWRSREAAALMASEQAAREQRRPPFDRAVATDGDGLSASSPTAAIAGGELQIRGKQRSRRIDDVVREFALSHLPGAINVPLGELPRRLADMPLHLPLVFICRSGGRSWSAANLAMSAGRESLAHLEGGMLAWAAALDPARFRPQGNEVHPMPLDLWRWLMRAWLKADNKPERITAAELAAAGLLRVRLDGVGLRRLGEQLDAAVARLRGQPTPPPHKAATRPSSTMAGPSPARSSPTCTCRTPLPFT